MNQRLRARAEVSMNEQKTVVNIIGAGLAGLSAAKTFAGKGIRVRLISFQNSERAQSNLAEGGINAVMNVMGENDRIEYHFEDTMKGGCYLADPKMVQGMVSTAPSIIRDMMDLGVPFHTEDGKLIQRNFGGQKMKRTTYAMSSTGKVLVVALTSAVLKYEAKGLVTRLSHHTFETLLFENGKLCGVQVYDRYQKKRIALRGPVLIACGGMNGMFEGATTGTTANTGEAAAVLFSQGVRFGNLEFLQYHPTTVGITGKRLLISEAARGEGGRLFYEKEGSGERCYFMEEKYGERGNLMPRDVISREMCLLGRQVFLDLTILDQKTWDKKLKDLRDEVIHYMGVDPAKEPIPIAPGIHYFMGGILVDEGHRTNIRHLYAAGECACAYHGANRLGGNSLLGAIYGGQKAAGTILQEIYGICVENTTSGNASSGGADCSSANSGSTNSSGVNSGSANSGGVNSGSANSSDVNCDGVNSSDANCGRNGDMSASGSWQEAGPGLSADDPCLGDSTPETIAFSPAREQEKELHDRMIQVLLKGMAPLRTLEGMQDALDQIRAMECRENAESSETAGITEGAGSTESPEGTEGAGSTGRPEGAERSQVMEAELLLAEAMLQCALQRTETRGAHTRLDYPDTDENWKKTTVVGLMNGRIQITYEKITPYPAA